MLPGTCQPTSQRAMPMLPVAKLSKSRKHPSTVSAQQTSLGEMQTCQGGLQAARRVAAVAVQQRGRQRSPRQSPGFGFSLRFRLNEASVDTSTKDMNRRLRRQKGRQHETRFPLDAGSDVTRLRAPLKQTNTYGGFGEAPTKQPGAFAEGHPISAVL